MLPTVTTGWRIQIKRINRDSTVEEKKFGQSNMAIHDVTRPVRARQGKYDRARLKHFHVLILSNTCMRVSVDECCDLITMRKQSENNLTKY
jgi:hypothetical protein